MREGTCPVCSSKNISLFLNLGPQPPANGFALNNLSSISVAKYELFLMICLECLYVWLGSTVSANELFTENPYLTGTSAETQLDMRNLVNDCLGTCSSDNPKRVIDIASNDGTLLDLFRNEGFEIMGIDPSKPAYEISKSRGIPTINDFFGADITDKILSSFGKADVVTGTNIITHVENPIEFLNNCKRLLKSKGSIVLEFYNFDYIISNNAFDQIYHEHISYFNFTTFVRLVKRLDLEAYKVEEVHAQGGSLRVFLSIPGRYKVDESVVELLKLEGGPDEIKKRFLSFPKKVNKHKDEILNLLREKSEMGLKIAGYGASAKATVLLNYLKLSSKEIIAIADKSQTKQGKFVPGVGVPVVSPMELVELRPDLVVIFAWNLKDEITKVLNELFGYKVSTVTFMPKIILSYGNS